MTGYRMSGQWFLARHRFGIAADDVRFTGYWEKDTGIAWDRKDVAVSAWRQPGKIMLIVVGTQKGNLSPVDVTIRLDAKQLGLPEVKDWYVFDAEALATYACLDTKTGKPLNVYPDAGAALRLGADGSLTLKAVRHDYRLIIIQSRTLPPPAGSLGE